MESAEKESITVPKPDTRIKPAPYEETKANQMSPSEGLPYGCYLEGMKAGRQTGVQKRKARMCSAVPDVYEAAGVAVKHATTGQRRTREMESVGRTAGMERGGWLSGERSR